MPEVLAGFQVTSPKKLETGLRTVSDGIPCALLFRTEAIGFPTFGLLPYFLTPNIGPSNLLGMFRSMNVVAPPGQLFTQKLKPHG